MRKSITNGFSVLRIVQALIWATGWFFILWIDQYPPNEWVGVVAIGCLAWYVSYTLMNNTMRFALARVYRYAVEVYGEPKNEPVSVSKRAELIIAFLVALLIYSVGFTTSGFMFILAWLGLITLDFPTLDTNIKLVGLVSMMLGLIMTLPLLGAVFYMLALGKNRLSIRERFTHVSALAWSLITKERFMPKWGFGLDSQYIERLTA